ncbi:hypothetical protein H9Q13_05755 [Pontibacter sp. JH31]|uniref:Uncharacterized protein n=1 Tax=Pontibacter aquaedesilientis TaxID=2766980 RepID=A0ABR7XEE8_9BACT|nr:hypothetical protein [Pontibacter aquaedesilientis]MBD1396664.1 hypothetical protein [Pontibacter aquaedesilientis]
MLNRIYGFVLLTLLIVALFSSCDDNTSATDGSEVTNTAAMQDSTILPNTI